MAEVEAQDDEVVPESEVLPFLPDDVLIKIFEYLPGRELFSVRAVCRRWAELALHPDVWRLQDLDNAGPGFCRAVLRLAPCARSLTLDWRRKLPAELLWSTFCAVKTLRLYPDDTHCALAFIAALEQQGALGRLREVTVSCLESVSLGQFHALFRALFTTHGLTGLSLYIGRECLEWLPEGRLVAPSLKKLDFWSNETGPSRFAVLRHLVDCHAPTLEVLDCSSVGPYDYSCPSAAWLVKARQLRELLCPVVMQDMQALAQLEYLQSLTLVLEASKDVPVSPGIRKYLRQAKQLTSLTLICQDMDLGPLLLHLVQDVASCTPSALEVLRLDFQYLEEPLEALLSALPKLVALRELRVCVNGAATLRLMACLSAIERSERSRASSLTLHIQGKFNGGETDCCCCHGWLHKNQALIRRFFEEFPGLHLKIKLYKKCASSLCPAGGEDWDILDWIRFPLVFFGHSDSYICDLPHGTGSASQNLRANECAVVLQLKYFLDRS